MKVNVDEDLCIGCGACPAIVPEVFELNDQGLAYVKTNEYNENKKEEITDAKESCPTGAISIED
ncbi:MAG: ferredoxin [Bacilli bacterium]|nr:ferredoxin [Bacilli bacterium]